METKVSVLMQKYEWGKLLGQGNFAKVYHAKDIKSGRSVAIKIIDKDRIFREGIINQTKREISVMSLVKHPNVVQLYEVMASKTKVYFVMEYVKGGELLQKLAKGKMKEVAARKYFQQLISAIDFCHSRGVYHRDIKLENLLLDENGNLKISDFGLSAVAESKRQDGLLHTVCGTPAYVAPEVLINNGYDGSKADIWSCGVTLFVLLARYLPFLDSNMMEMYRRIARAELEYPDWISADVRELISQMLDPNPNTRICVSKIMENPWFRKGFKPRKPKEAMNGADATIKVCESISNTLPVPGTKVDLAKPARVNAFDIISRSPGLDLSGIFEDADKKKDVKFTSNQSASSIMLKLDELAKRLKLKVIKKDGGFLKMQGSKPGRKGLVSIDAEILEFTPTFHLVEMTKSDGDTLEYQKLMKEEIRPSLKDIVWTWQGSEPQLQQQMEPPELHLP